MCRHLIGPFSLFLSKRRCAVGMIVYQEIYERKAEALLDRRIIKASVFCPLEGATIVCLYLLQTVGNPGLFQVYSDSTCASIYSAVVRFVLSRFYLRNCS